jgi:hypothetical protein
VEPSDAPCSGRPTTAVTLALLQYADELLRNDRWITTRKLETELLVSKGSVNNIIDALRYAKMCARWVPRSLTDDHITLLKEVCSYLLSCYEADGESFLSWIVTGDETWSHHFEPETRNQSVEWHHPTSPWKKKFMVTPSAGKVMATAFWDAEGVILVDIMPHVQIINSDLYFQTLKNLQKHLRRVRPHKIVAEILQHTTTHTSLKTQEAIKKLRLFFPTRSTAQILLPQISTSLEPSKMSSMGKGLGVMVRLLKK